MPLVGFNRLTNPPSCRRWSSSVLYLVFRFYMDSYRNSLAHLFRCLMTLRSHGLHSHAERGNEGMQSVGTRECRAWERGDAERGNEGMQSVGTRECKAWERGSNIELQFIIINYQLPIDNCQLSIVPRSLTWSVLPSSVFCPLISGSTHHSLLITRH